MKFQCKSNDLYAYGEFINRFCRECVKKSLALKKKCEGTVWNDEVFSRFADDMDRITENVISSLDMLSDGYKVITITWLYPLVEEYLKTANDFPIGG